MKSLSRNMTLSHLPVVEERVARLQRVDGVPGESAGDPWRESRQKG